MKNHLLFTLLFIFQAQASNIDIKNSKKYTQVFMGYNNICAIDSLKNLECWSGENSVNAIEAIPNEVSQVKKVVIHGGLPKHTVACAIHHETKLSCWGKDAREILVLPYKTAKDVSIAFNHACIIDEFDQVKCWGKAMKESPLPTDLGEVIQISSGPFFSCALTKMHIIKCWGYGFDYSEIPSTFRAKEIAVGGNHLCARELNGKVGDDIKCFGVNGNGQTLVPVDLGEVISFGVGDRHSCALVKNDPWLEKPLIRCWGDTHMEQMTGEMTMPKSLKYSQISFGGYSVCGILNGDLYCFGNVQNFYKHSKISIPMKNQIKWNIPSLVN